MLRFTLARFVEEDEGDSRDMRLRRGPYGERREKSEHRRWWLRKPRDTLEDMVYRDRQGINEGKKIDRDAEARRLANKNADENNQKQTVAATVVRQVRRVAANGGCGALLCSRTRNALCNRVGPLPRKGSKACKRIIEEIKAQFVRTFAKPRRKRKRSCLGEDQTRATSICL